MNCLTYRLQKAGTNHFQQPLSPHQDRRESRGFPRNAMGEAIGHVRTLTHQCWNQTRWDVCPSWWSVRQIRPNPCRIFKSDPGQSLFMYLPAVGEEGREVVNHGYRKERPESHKRKRKQDEMIAGLFLRGVVGQHTDILSLGYTKRHVYFVPAI